MFCEIVCNGCLDRDYVAQTVVTPRLEEVIKKDNGRINKIEDDLADMPDNSRDFLELLLENHISNPNFLTWPICLFEICDLIGGHSAVGNLLMRLLGFLALNKGVQNEMCNEAKEACIGNSSPLITLEDRASMPLTEAR